jgi:hypothetical protein
MIRKHWRELEFWRWWWHDTIRFEVKAVATVIVLALMLGGGWIAADRLSSASASGASSPGFTFETTVEKVVTVREKGRLVRKLVPVVRKVFVKRQTRFKTLTDVTTDLVRTPGGVRIVRHRVVKLVPVVTKKVVTVNGKTKTLVTTQLVPTTNVQTQTLTQTQTQTQTQTDVRTQTQTQTQTDTVTNEQTVTQPVTETVTTTITPVTVTTTVTQAPVTVTETVTVTTGATGP